MGIDIGPIEVTDGLVFHLDAGNTRSYGGSGLTTNGLVAGIGATLLNGTGFSSANGGSFFFDGTNDFIITSNIDLTSYNKITVICWVKVLNYRENGNNSNIIFEFSNNFNSSSGGFVAAFADGSAVYSSLYPVALGIRGNSGYNLSSFSKTLVNDLKWHHWCCIFDKSLSSLETSLYIDGVIRSSILDPIVSDNSNNFANDNLYIGSRSAASIPANMNLSSLQIYNRILSQQEILQNYNATKGRYR